jgi:hypothetical protein
MEVHHHPTVEKKNFKEYFLEFLMIFLAVTLGFFAEQIRENFVEHHLEKQYIQSLYEDLQTDTARLAFVINQDNRKMNAFENLSKCYDTVLKNLSDGNCMEELIKYSRYNLNFEATDRTIQQLANAGGYRLLSKEDADSIILYEGLIKTYHNFESTLFQEAQDNVRNTLNSLLAFQANEQLMVNETRGQSSLIFSTDKTLLNKCFNEFLLYQKVTKTQIDLLTRINTKGKRLIGYYKNKHHLE